MKKWSEMTEAEINQLKSRQCIRCAYLIRQTGNHYATMMCDYILIEGHRRGCSPLECMGGAFKSKHKRSKKGD